LSAVSARLRSTPVSSLPNLPLVPRLWSPEQALCSGRFFERSSALVGIDACWLHGPAAAHSSTIAADASVDVIVRIPRSAEVAPAPFVSPATGRAFEVEVETGEVVLGVRLRPGYGGPLQHLRPEVLAASGAGFRRDPSLTALEAMVGRLLDEVGPPPAVVRELLALAGETSGAARLTTGSPRTERALQRAAKTWLGLSAKRLMRIERVRAARRLIVRGHASVEVAGELSFADQAHLCREYRHFLGTTPEADRVGNLQDQREGGG
jgi:hypothetical protein